MSTKYLCFAAVGIATGVLSVQGASPAEAPKGNERPNILFMIADDWGFPFAGAYGDKVVKTPVFDRMAAEGILFNHAYCAAPSCTPSRGAILTGQYPHRLREGGNLHGTLDVTIPNYVTILESNGYFTGKFRKAWGPGDFKVGGYTQDPGGKNYQGFPDFYRQKPEGQPFCFWFGSSDPHRPYALGSGEKAGYDKSAVKVPGFLPDVETTRGDILDYYFEINRFDTECGEVIEFLRDKGELDNTIVIITGDNGMPFPRAKATLYDYGTHIPLVIRWGKSKPKGISFDGFINLSDLAPTFLEAAGVPVPAVMTGRSLYGFLKNGRERTVRSLVFTERERHANVRISNQGYPARAITTHNYLYIRNYRPDRWPAGNPTLLNGKMQYGDIDGSPSKTLILEMIQRAVPDPLALLSVDKRPAEELYDMQADPYQLKNLAADAPYQSVLKMLAAKMDSVMSATADPRVDRTTDIFDTYPYYGNNQVINEKGEAVPVAKPRGN